MPCPVNEGVLCFAVESCVVTHITEQMTEYIFTLILLMRGEFAAPLSHFEKL